MNIKRHYPIGAEYFSGHGVHFRVWAPDHKKVSITIESTNDIIDEIELERDSNGYFSILVKDAIIGSLYRYRLGNEKQLLPDPASRAQPSGPEGPSKVISPLFSWSDKSWHGVKKGTEIIYEMHIGTFTKEGTFKAAMDELAKLAELGITLIELMPVNEFPGHFGWGYDGVNLFAPYHVYGSPEDLKKLIDHAHAIGIGVILDVVYNHFGPESNFITQFTKKYFNSKEETEWGDAINFDHPSSREFFLTNAMYWIEEFHFDGLRVDATPWFFCESKEHILSELTKVIQSKNPQNRKIVIGENEKQDATLLKTYEKGGYQFDALWNDDFHHSACVRLKGKREAYYTDYLGSPQEFISALKYGFLYQGQYYSWQKKCRGTPSLNFPASAFVIFIENHDQIANTASGKRLHQLSDPGIYRAMTTLMLLGPNIPLIFQGQEFASSAPFYYFADHNEDLNLLVKNGRKEFLAQFPSIKNRPASENISDPSNIVTFTDCKLDHNEREKNREQYIFHRDLIALRQKDSVFRNVQNLKIDGSVLTSDFFLIRIFGEENGDRLILINFGIDHILSPAPEPLLVAGEGLEWKLIFSSASIKYGGEGTPFLVQKPWKMLGHSALVLETSPIVQKE